MTAIIRITIPDTTDETALTLKKKIEAVLQGVKGADIEITITSR